MPAALTRANAFTVDVEEWFHICGVGGALSPAAWDSLPSRVAETSRRLLDELDRAGVRATFFVLGWIAERHPALVAEIAAAGHEVGSHGHLHARAFELGAQGFADDVRCATRALTEAGAGAIRAFRAPEWSINSRSLWALDELARQGFTVDASMAPVRLVGQVDFPRRPHLRTTPAGPLVEVPPFVVDRFGQVLPQGWGWCLRMSSPLTVLQMVEAANRAGMPAVFMVHPWEIDSEPPRTALPLRLRFAHYFRLDGFRDRLRTILRGTEFGAIADLAEVR